MACISQVGQKAIDVADLEGYVVQARPPGIYVAGDHTLVLLSAPRLFFLTLGACWTLRTLILGFLIQVLQELDFAIAYGDKRHSEGSLNSGLTGVMGDSVFIRGESFYRGCHFRIGLGAFHGPAKPPGENFHGQLVV